MATIIKVAGADFSSNAIGFLPPISSGLLYWAFYGNTLAKSLMNLAPGGSGASVWSGGASPDVSAAYISTTGKINTTGKALDTGIMATSSVTLLSVGRSSDTLGSTSTRPFLISNFNSTHGDGVYFSGTTGLPQGTLTGTMSVSSGTPTTAGGSVSEANASLWGFRGISATASTNIKIFNRTTAQTTTVTSAVPRLARTDYGYSIGGGGGGVGGSFTGQADHAFAAVYGRALSDAEIDTIYAFVKTYLAAKSITI